MAKARLRKIGQVVVDSGSIVISDPCIMELAAPALELDWQGEQHVSFGMPGLQLGVLARTGLGDGTYSVYAEFGRHPVIPDHEIIRRIEIRFV